jgi:hypothetical protein
MMRIQQGLHHIDIDPAIWVEEPFARRLRPIAVGDGVADHDELSCFSSFIVSLSFISWWMELRNQYHDGAVPYSYG